MSNRPPVGRSSRGSDPTSGPDRLQPYQRTDHHRADASLDPASTFTALGDEDCRRILDCIAEEPMTVTELSDICELPSSTTYRKIDMLLDAGLVEEHTRISTDGRHASQYVPSVDRVTIDITGAAVSALEV